MAYTKKDLESLNKQFLDSVKTKKTWLFRYSQLKIFATLLFVTAFFASYFFGVPHLASKLQHFTINANSVFKFINHVKPLTLKFLNNPIGKAITSYYAAHAAVFVTGNRGSKYKHSLVRSDDFTKAYFKFLKINSISEEQKQKASNFCLNFAASKFYGKSYSTDDSDILMQHHNKAFADLYQLKKGRKFTLPVVSTFIDKVMFDKKEEIGDFTRKL
ncbi:MAG: hypothetical protein BGO27_05720 [Alphaproteobacteria bacterium 33-17]|nr:MAG: hypothetical protein BGO27_05720 [Alphaproteobacteria bacterium 33-17]